MTKSVDSVDSQLTLVAALDLAIFIERDARDRYVTLARVMEAWGQGEAAAFFMRMARLEEEHRAQLETRRHSVWPPEAPLPAEEVDPRLKPPDIVEGPNSEDEAMRLTLRTSLELAVRAEHCARSFFLSAVSVVSVPEVQKLFRELADEEVEHEELLQNELHQLAQLDGEPEKA
jgi:rubrerythrin